MNYSAKREVLEQQLLNSFKEAEERRFYLVFVCTVVVLALVVQLVQLISGWDPSLWVVCLVGIATGVVSYRVGKRAITDGGT